MAPKTGKVILSVAILLLILNMTTAKSTKQVARKPPHVVLIVADDLGFNDVSWNNPNIIMPHMHKLAKEGVKLNQSYVQPTCTPTRAAILTGRYPYTMGLQKGVIKPFEPRGVPTRHKMLPHFLRKAGYETHALGKWHLGFCSWDYTPTRRGFDSFYGFYMGAQDHYTHKRSASVRPTFRSNENDYLDLRNNTKADSSKTGVYSTHLFSSYAKDLLKKRNPKKPMFLYYPFQSVHAPLQVPRNYLEKYKNVRGRDRRKYLGMVTAMDAAVGDLVKVMKKTGHYDNSVIIFTSDNGGPVNHGASNWPLRGQKNSLWEGGTRSAAFIHSPHLPNPGTTSNNLIHATDWFSTIMEIAGGEDLVPKVDGFNQWDAIAGLSDSPRTRMIYNMDETRKFKAGVRFNNYKLLVGGMARKNWVSRPTFQDVPVNRRGKHLVNSDDEFPSTSEVESSSIIGDDDEEDDEEENDDKEVIMEKEKVTVDDGTRQENNAIEGNATMMSSFANTTMMTFTTENTTMMSFTTENTTKISFTTENTTMRTFTAENTTMTPTTVMSLSVPETSERKEDSVVQEECDCIMWKKLKNNPEFVIDDDVMAILDSHFYERTKIRLFNVQDDPEERNNLSSTETTQISEMLSYIAKQIRRYMPVTKKRPLVRAHPVYWQNIWSPGWCRAQF